MRENLEQYARRRGAEMLKEMTPEERLEGLTVKERLAGLSLQERLKGLSPDEILAALSPEVIATVANELKERGTLRRPTDAARWLDPRVAVPLRRGTMVRSALCPHGASPMTANAGRPLAALDTPALLLDLDALDRNLAHLHDACRRHGKDLRVHFKSLKCGSLANYLSQRGVRAFLCAKVNEAEVLVAAGQRDVFVANQVIGECKLARLAALAKSANIRACVDDAGNVAQLGNAARAAGVTVEVLVEVDVGMNRCGVEPGAPVLELARAVVREKGLRFVGLQGYDGQLQLLTPGDDKQTRALAGLDKLGTTKRLLEEQGIAVEVVTGAGTGTWEYAASHPAMTELQPGSFLLMDAAYHAVRPEFACSLSILTTVVSRRPEWYVLDAGSKAISQDFGKPLIKGRAGETVVKLAEEHTKVEDEGRGPKVGERREVYPAHCCATMNLHRQVVAMRGGVVEAVWPIEASGRYD